MCGTPVSCLRAMAMESKNTGQGAGKNSNKTIMPKCGPSNIHEADRNSKAFRLMSTNFQTHLTPSCRTQFALSNQQVLRLPGG